MANSGAEIMAGRRELLRLALGLSLVTACRPGRDPVERPRPALASAVAVYAWFDLPDDPRCRELSGLAWEESSRTLWAVQDESGSVVALTPNADFTSWTLGQVVTLDVSFPLDLEAVVVLSDGFIVASEKGPRVLEVDRSGKLRRDIPLPAHFAKARENRSLESLAMTPDGRYLYTANEDALRSDGALPTPHAGTHVRILRMTRTGGEAEERAYLTDPLPSGGRGGDYGVADLAALGGDELLVLERGWANDFGNTVRIYRVSFADRAASCIDMPSLGDAGPVLAKVLVADIGKLPTKTTPVAKQKQPSPLLENYEGLAIGPVLPDGRRALFLVSDDNNRADQIARLLVLAIG